MTTRLLNPLLRAATLVLGAALGLHVAGCGSGSSRGIVGNFAADNGLAVHTTTVAANAASTLALQAALARMDPAWQPIAASPSVSTSGSATNGQVVLDFGSSSSSGTDVNGAVLRGTLSATYARSGATATVSVSFGSLTITTKQLGLADVTGGLTMNVNIGGVATGTITGTVTTTSASEQGTVTPNVTYSLPAGATATAVLSGTLAHTSSHRGSWTVALGNLTSQVNPQPRQIFSGSVTLARTSGSAVTVSLIFNGPNQGQVTTSPDGTNTTFKL